MIPRLRWGRRPGDLRRSGSQGNDLRGPFGLEHDRRPGGQPGTRTLHQASDGGGSVALLCQRWILVWFLSEQGLAGHGGIAYYQPSASSQQAFKLRRAHRIPSQRGC